MRDNLIGVDAVDEEAMLVSGLAGSEGGSRPALERVMRLE